MNNEFDYISFAQSIKSQAWEILPEDISNDDKLYIVKTMENFVNKTGSALTEDDSLNFSKNDYIFCCQIIAEWTFHKGIDIVRAGIPTVWYDSILQKIAFTIFEIIKQAIIKDVPEEQIIETVEYHVNKAYKSRLEEIYARNEITLEVYNKALEQSNIDKMSFNKSINHNNFYQIESSKDEEYLKDKVIEIYGKSIAYRYLIKASHVLKHHKCNNEDRKKVLCYLREGVSYIINLASCSSDKLSKDKIERLITVSMEILFHRIVVLYKNNILETDNIAKEIVTYLATYIYSIEMQYIKDNDKLKETYEFTNLVVNTGIKNYLREKLEQGSITKEQYGKILDKSYIPYLENEICKLMNTKNIPKTIRNTVLVIMVIFILKLLEYFIRYN